MCKHIFHMLILFSIYNEMFGTKIKNILQLFHCTFPVPHHNTLQSIKKQVVTWDTS